MDETVDNATLPVAPPLDAAGSVPSLDGGGMAEQFLAFVDAGGPVVVILLGCSVVALAIILMKFWQFYAARLGDRRRAPQAIALLRRGRADEALALLADSRNPVAQVVARAIRGRQRRDLPEAVVREEVMRCGNEALEGLRGQLGALEVIGSVSPLLGLFGTVLGMIEAFRQLAEAGSQVSPAILSAGIWEALLTTAVGLAVAIPVVVLCNWFERRVERVAHDMENLVTQVFTPDLTTPALTTPEVTTRDLTTRDLTTRDLTSSTQDSHDSASLRLAAAD